jgi:hypothetical protein
MNVEEAQKKIEEQLEAMRVEHEQRIAELDNDAEARMRKLIQEAQK